ncbi:hypothetical protein PR202_gb29063 [Eleusine coracana subsp. coracana]|uniref:Uncharacterized protein n=1 Tax=Eleusine coracana subsp. coracana TaxID=191504 RepID=A0AAV5FZK6_ELECO|nr:hypothetical protein QOZ80_8AG0614570 [Eleusine coracana subsp. coracana]GJN39910.1 hypothetical protein PR202_gb29063 [Eleusine coracana subsp. coracana]
MAVPPHAMPPEQQQQDDEEEEDDDFTFPTPPQFLAGARGKDRREFHLPCSSPLPAWLHLSSSPIRRSFSAAAASPLSRCRSPALSDYAAEGEEVEEEERMDSLWEDLNDDEGDDLFVDDVSRRRSSVDAAARERSKEREAVVLGASRSSRRRAPALVTMMRALKKVLVAHKGKSRVHRDEHEQSTIASASASSPFTSPFPSPYYKKK